MGLFDKFKNGLRKTAQQITGNLETLLKGGARLTAESRAELEERLLAADVGAVTAQAIIREVEENLQKTGSGQSAALLKPLREALLSHLLKGYSPWTLPKPVVVLLAGVNGAGKTTTAGKLASRFSSEGRKVLLAAGDTFRAAAEEQLTEWAARAKVELVRGAHGAAPSAVVFDALKSGLSNGVDCFVVDTAGRLHNRQNLMEELKKIARVIDKAAPDIPKEKWLVLDANTGQNAIHQAREFHKDVGLTGIVLTKLDGTAKGGVVLALAEELGLPLRFLGMGEGIEDLVPYDPRMFAQGLVPESAVNV
ncbi:MAG TPA: signal recognition particle-docking protein FtsY [bacterium]|nr:signal recognition particle-docking protein FtsY [bacterium]